jgi:ribose transport system ATP-binding protein
MRESGIFPFPPTGCRDLPGARGGRPDRPHGRADQPLSARGRRATVSLVRQLATTGIAVVYISHFLEEVREIADRYTVLRDGRTVDTGVLAATTDERIVAQMVGREMARLFPERPTRTIGDVVLSVTDLAAPPGLVSKASSFVAVRFSGSPGWSARDARAGARSSASAARPRAGSSSMASRWMRHAKPATRLREGFGYVSEDRKGEGPALPLSVADNLTATRLAAFSSRPDRSRRTT